jgi:hypothetical protein
MFFSSQCYYFLNLFIHYEVQCTVPVSYVFVCYRDLIVFMPSRLFIFRNEPLEKIKIH